MKRRITELVCAFGMLAHAVPAAADVSCAGSSTVLSFGSYDVFGAAPADTQTDFVVTCTRTGGPRRNTIEVGIGPSAVSGSIPNRQMRHSNGDRMNYNLYRDASRIGVWGNTGGVDTVSRTAELENKTTDTVAFTIFGRAFPGQNLSPGFYSDSLLITISY